ncbi:MAG: ferritin family protein [Candidatus Omnitrophota bacterium]
MGLFNATEIADIGIEKEKMRKEFYARVAEKFSDKDIKELFTKLRDWEDTHIKKFTEIREKLSQSETTGSYPGEMNDYIKSLMDDTLYKEISPEQFSNRVTTPVSAVQYGIGFEKDAILFFNEFINTVSDNDKKIIKQLIEEEKSHIIFLSNLKKKINKE